MSEIDQLREALLKLARALPGAEERLVQATVDWTPERADAYAELRREVGMLRREAEHIAARLEELGSRGGPQA